MSEPVTVEELREARNATPWVVPSGRHVVHAKHHATLLRALDEAMVVLKELAQSKGWLLGDTERVSVALDNADTIIATYEEAKGD